MKCHVKECNRVVSYEVSVYGPVPPIATCSLHFDRATLVINTWRKQVSDPSPLTVKIYDHQKDSFW